MIKRKQSIQRKINGNEIRDKKTLQKMITLYDSYLSKRSENSNASESFYNTDMYNTMYIAEEKLTAAQRKALPNSAFGLPKLRKYPLIIQNENGEYDGAHYCGVDMFKIGIWYAQGMLVVSNYP